MKYFEPYILKLQNKKDPSTPIYLLIIGLLVLLFFVPLSEISQSSVVLFLCSLCMLVFTFYKITKNTNHLKKINEQIESAKKQLEIKNRELITQNNKNEEWITTLVNANKELSAFTYIASHDLQEPLRKTQLFISRIMEDPEQLLSERNMEYFKRMEISSKRMQLLINDLLSYSRINESDKKLLDINLNNVIDNVLRDLALAQTIEETNTTITRGSLPEIKGIPFQLEQLFTNLISNSIKYSYPNRTPLINIQYSVVKGTDVPDIKTNEDRNYYKISVEDNGIGFEQEYAEKIFMLFLRLHDKQTYSGSGIGLTICKKIVENHQGFISAAGTPNQGSTFAVYLPVTDNDIP